MDTLIEATRRVEQHHFWFRGFRRFVRPFLIGAGGGQPLRILDCGCGTGSNLVVLAQFGKVYGLDFNWNGLRHAKSSGNHRLIQATVAQIPFLDCTFDLVTSFDVLYCLDDATEQLAIREMFRLVRPGGSAVINVPAMSLLRGDHSVFVREVRRYSRQRLRHSLESVGFRVQRMTHTNAVLFLPMLVVRLLQRFRGLSSPEHAKSDFGLPPKPINALLSGLLTLEAMVVRWADLSIGSSILCLARKPTSE